MLLRIRITSFLAGFGVAAGLALYQLRQDILKSNATIAAQVGAVRAAAEALGLVDHWVCVLPPSQRAAAPKAQSAAAWSSHSSMGNKLQREGWMICHALVAMPSIAVPAALAG